MTSATTPKSFNEEVRASVTRFVQSAVVIDDEAYIVDRDQERLRPVGPLNDPEDDLMDATETIIQNSERRDIEKLASYSSDHIEGHTLNAKRIIAAFAEHGIICGVINPDQDDDFVPRTFKLVRKADFIILDYKIHKSSEATFRFLQKVATEDVTSNRQRAMIIYTGEDGIQEIAQEVKQKLDELGLGQSVVSIGQRPTAMRIGSLIIDVVRKPKREVKEYIELPGGRLDEANVPDHLIGLYAELANGLLQAAVLESLSIVREQMPQLANLFNADMDAAYLAHRALVDKDDAPGIVTANLATAIENLLGSEEAQHKLGKTLVHAWIVEKLNGGTHLSLNIGEAKDVEFSQEHLVSMVEKGLKDTPLTFNDAKSTEIDEEQKSLIAPRIAEIFTGSANLARLSNARFAMTTSLSRRNDSSYSFETRTAPYLQLGCVIEDLTATNGHRYFLCIQPVCNSVRLKPEKSTQFPFMPFQTVTPKSDTKPLPVFDLVVPSQIGQPEYLKAILKPASITMLEFKAKAEGKVVSVCNTKGVVFLSAGAQEKPWRWVAQLKAAHAQRLVQQFATNLSRVGLDESEWLRQSAQGNWRLN